MTLDDINKLKQTETDKLIVVKAPMRAVINVQDPEELH